jgi:DNA-binding CsgD family transcriptional regulator
MIGVLVKQAQSSNYMESALALAKLIGSDLVTQQDYCQIVGLKIFPENPPKAVGFYILHADGTYSLTSSFGFSENMEEKLNHAPLEISSPVVDSIRRSRILWIETSEALNQEYPTYARETPIEFRAPIIAIPLFKRGLPIGALGIFGSEEKLSADAFEYLELISALLATNLRHGILLALEISDPYKGLLLGLPLTPREKDIQILMGGGSTNREISVDLGFSESTVRKDSVSLFAKLGVNTRKAAADLLQE